MRVWQPECDLRFSFTFVQLKHQPLHKKRALQPVRSGSFQTHICARNVLVVSIFPLNRMRKAASHKATGNAKHRNHPPPAKIISIYVKIKFFLMYQNNAVNTAVVKVSAICDKPTLDGLPRALEGSSLAVKVGSSFFS